jgi:hypothetical protein
LQRIEGPYHRSETQGPCAPPLLELEQAPDTSALMRGMHTCELRIQDESILQSAQKRKGKADQLLAVERAQDQSTDSLRAGHCRHGHDVSVFGDTPGPALQLLASAQFISAAHIADGHDRHSSGGGVSH